MFQCNNPQTKEAKLVAAERIISEWSGYDEDIKAVLSKHKTSKTRTDKYDQKIFDESKHTEL